MKEKKKNSNSHLARLQKASIREAVKKRSISIEEANSIILESIRDDSELVQETAHGEQRK